jgi:filamentous hemagglutinin family protein
MSNKKTIRMAERGLSTSVRLGVSAVAACFIVGPAFSNPVNPTVVNGTATFNQVGKVLTVTNSNGAIINWDKFSIKAGETTHFAQSSASSSVLNRVLANDPTSIYGTLSSNGRVWLVNPAGIMVGAGGRVDVAGFVASTLNISNGDFLAGRALFANDDTAQHVINQGEIRTPSGGSVYLIGAKVTNEGIIHSQNGEVILAAGQTVSLIDSATPGVKVDITGAEGNATNLGQITAEAGRIGIVGVIVRNSGQLNASSVVSDGGRIFLKASGDTLVEGGKLSAISANGKGGQIDVLGDRVALMGTSEIDASGAMGGGYVRVGGDYQGANPEVANARVAYVGANTVLKADATETGAGGTAIVWADDATRAFGTISAHGAGGGAGGFVETSGKNYLDVGGIRVDTSGGRWLLDPTDITVVHSGGSGGSSFAGGIFLNGGGITATINDFDINANLASNDITITTSSGGFGTGDIRFDASVGGAIAIANTSGNRNLTLAADNDIIFTGGSTTFSAGSSSPLDIGFDPGAGRRVEIQAGASAIFNGTDGASPIRAAIKGASGKSWENFGTVTLVGNSYIDLNRDAGITSTFYNNPGGVLNLNSTQGWAIQSEPVNQAEAINNGGTINVNASTSIEAAYSQFATGTLNIGAGQGLSVQHLDSVAGTVNLAGGQLSLLEQHAGSYSFSGAVINGPGTLQIGKGAGGSMTTVLFNNVTTSGGLKILREQFGGLNFSGANTFADTKFFANDISNSNIHWNVPVASYSGDVQWWAKGDISLAGNLAFGGPATLAAGWNTNIGTPSVTPANPGNLSIVGRQITGTAINLLAGGDISLNATTASATVNGTGPMVVNAGGQLALFGSASGGYNASLNTTGSQTINVGSINMAAGSGGNWAYSRIRADGDQQITTTNGGISAGGAGGSFYGGFALIEHGTGGGNQSINIHSVGLNLAGGNATGTTNVPAEVSLLVPAACSADPACLAQPVTGALAFISNRSGSQTIDFQSPATLTITGGSGGIRNAASITHSGGGLQTISGAPNATLAGGGSGGNNYKTADGFHYLRNSATIFAPGVAQSLDFNTLTINSTGTNATGSGGAAIVGAGQTIDVAGALILAAGNTNAGGGAVVIQSTAGQTINAGGTTITGGGIGYDNIAAIRQLGSGAVGQNLSFASLAITGGSGTGTAGDTGDCGAPCAGHAASNHAGIYNAGTQGQDLNVAGAITVTGGSGGNRNNAYIQNRSSGLQTVTAGTLSLQGGDSGGENSFWSYGQANVWGGSWLANSASITSGWSGGVVGAQNIASAGAIMVKGNSGAGTGGMGSAGIASTGSQTVSGTAISVIGGAGMATYDNAARIVSLGTQSITANSMVLTGGATGVGNRAGVVGSGQSIQIAGGLLTVTGGGTSATDFSNVAEILNQGGAGQSIVFSAAATMTVAGGAGSGFSPNGDNDCGAPCNNLSSWNAAQVRNESGAQTINFQGGGSLAITGGGNGNENYANVQNKSAGAQQILGNPAITISRGASGGVQIWAPSLVDHPGTRRWHELTNDAGIEADGAQTINASSITMNAGAGTALGGVFIGGLTQNITVTGALSMTGGAAGDAVNAPITGTGFDPVTEFLFKAPAVIGNDSTGHSLMLNVGSLAMTGGGYGLYGGSPALIGTYKHATNTTINAGSGIMLNAAPGAGSVQIGSFLGNGGALTMSAGGVGMALDRAFIGTGNTGSVILTTANGQWSQTAGGKITANSVAIVTGSGDVTQPVGAVIDAFMLNAAGNSLSFLGDNLATSVTLTSTGPTGGIAYNTAADAHIISATADTGDITLTTTSLPPAFLGLGTITASAGNVTVTAEHAILDDNGAALNITGQNIWLTSNGGGSAGGLAISMDTQASGWIKAKVNGGVGGIAIRNAGDFGPAFNASNYFDLDDSAAASGNSVGFHTAGNLDMGGASFKLLTNNAGDAAASAGGDLTYNGGVVFQTSTGAPYGRVVLQAGNDLAVNGLLGAVNGSINLSAGHQLAIHQAVTATDDIMLFAPVIDVTHPVSASGSIAVVGATVDISGIGSLSAAEVDVAASDLTMLGNGAEIWASAGDVRGIFLGHVTLNDGAHIKAPVGDVKLAFLGADSTLYLNDAPGYSNPSYIMASPSTVNLAFTNRDSGGIVIDGSETATTVAGGSGFYTGGPPGVGTPLAKGAGLVIAYPNPVGLEILAVLANAIERATDAVDAGSSPTDGDGGPQPGEGRRGLQDRAEGGGDGSFGESGDNKDEKKDDKKDDKDKKAADDGKDGKKDEKPAQKKLAQCT